MSNAAAVPKTRKGVVESGAMAAITNEPSTAARAPDARATAATRRSSRPLARPASRPTAQVSGAMNAPSTTLPAWALVKLVPNRAIGSAETKVAIGSHSSKAGLGATNGGVA